MQTRLAQNSTHGAIWQELSARGPGRGVGAVPPPTARSPTTAGQAGSSGLSGWKWRCVRWHGFPWPVCQWWGCVHTHAPSSLLLPLPAVSQATANVSETPGPPAAPVPTLPSAQARWHTSSQCRLQRGEHMKNCSDAKNDTETQEHCCHGNTRRRPTGRWGVVSSTRGKSQPESPSTLAWPLPVLA